MLDSLCETNICLRRCFRSTGPSMGGAMDLDAKPIVCIACLSATTAEVASRYWSNLEDSSLV